MLKSLLIEIAGRKASNFIKKDPNIDVFLSIFGNFERHLFSGTSAYDCFRETLGSGILGVSF